MAARAFGIDWREGSSDCHGLILPQYLGNNWRYCSSGYAAHSRNNERNIEISHGIGDLRPCFIGKQVRSASITRTRHCVTDQDLSIRRHTLQSV